MTAIAILGAFALLGDLLLAMWWFEARDERRSRAAEPEAAAPTPESVLLELAELYENDPELIADDLRGIATFAGSAAYGDLFGQPGGWSAQERDRLVRDLLDRICPDYTARSTPKGAAS